MTNKRTTINLDAPGADDPTPTIDLTTFRVIHRALMRDARLLANISAAWAGGQAATRAQLQDVADNFDHYFALLHHHHDGEDQFIWPAVAGGGGSEDMLGALTEEHRQLDPLLARLPGALHDLADHPGDRALTIDVARDATELADLLERHIDGEEADLFPVLETAVSPDRWRAVEKKLKRSMQPRHVGWFAAWVASAALPGEASRLPLRSLARLTGRGYGRRTARAFGPRLHDEYLRWGPTAGPAAGVAGGLEQGSPR